MSQLGSNLPRWFPRRACQERSSDPLRPYHPLVIPVQQGDCTEHVAL